MPNNTAFPTVPFNSPIPTPAPSPYPRAPAGPAYNPQPSRTGDVPYDPPKPSAPNGAPPSKK